MPLFKSTYSPACSRGEKGCAPGPTVYTRYVYRFRISHDGLPGCDEIPHQAAVCEPTSVADRTSSHHGPCESPCFRRWSWGEIFRLCSTITRRAKSFLRRVHSVRLSAGGNQPDRSSTVKADAYTAAHGGSRTYLSRCVVGVIRARTACRQCVRCGTQNRMLSAAYHAGMSLKPLDNISWRETSGLGTPVPGPATRRRISVILARRLDSPLVAGAAAHVIVRNAFS